jgi:FAD/FMN-containing dehydrogenase
MKHSTAEEKPNQTHARSLLADIQGAPETFLPRRETIVDWLNAYLLRSDRRGYVMEPTEADDLAAVEKLLRSHKVPVAARAAA